MQMNKIRSWNVFFETNETRFLSFEKNGWSIWQDLQSFLPKYLDVLMAQNGKNVNILLWKRFSEKSANLIREPTNVKTAKECGDLNIREFPVIFQL